MSLGIMASYPGMATDDEYIEMDPIYAPVAPDELPEDIVTGILHSKHSLTKRICTGFVTDKPRPVTTPTYVV